MYCYRQHSSPQISAKKPRFWLLSTAHFPARRHGAGIVIHGTIPGFTGIFPQFSQIRRVVIRRTVRRAARCAACVVIDGTFCGAGCYRGHIFHSVDFLQRVLLSAAQFRKKPPAAFSAGCYPPHNFCRVRRGQGCYPAHSFDSGNFSVASCYRQHISNFFKILLPVLLSAAQFAAVLPGLLSGAQFRKILRAARGVGTHGTFQKSCFRGCYRRHNLIFPQKSRRRIFAKKIFFCVVTPCTWLFPAQLCGYSWHNRVGTHGTFLL